jgi:hypothetical protein
MHEIDDRIAEIAEPQGWHIHYRQLRAIGLSRRAIEHRVSRGSLVRVFSQVFAVGHRPTEPVELAHGALLACGPRAALSHGSGGALWQIVKSWPQRFHVSTSLDRRPAGITTHHRPALLRTDITIEQGLRVTTPALTILDLAPTLSRRRLIRAVNELRLRDLLEIHELELLLERFPRHRGARRIRDTVGLAQREPSRSGIEDDWPPFAAAHGLTGWEMNVHVGPHRVDVLFLPDLLIVELDGWITHSLEPAIEEDKDRDADILERFGIPTIRIPRQQFRAAPGRQAARIHRILEGRRTR